MQILKDGVELFLGLWQLRLFLFGTAFGRSSATPSELQLHRPVDRGLKRGQTDVFSVAATTGQFVQLVARKKGLDVVVTIVDPAGKTLVSADSPNSGSGPEAAAWITEGQASTW